MADKQAAFAARKLDGVKAPPKLNQTTNPRSRADSDSTAGVDLKSQQSQPPSHAFTMVGFPESPNKKRPDAGAQGLQRPNRLPSSTKLGDGSSTSPTKKKEELEGRALSVLERFEFESRLREVVQQLVQPLYDQLSEKSDLITKMKFEQERVKRVTSDQERQIQMCEEKLCQIDTLRQLQQEDRQHIDQIASNVDKRVMAMNTEFETIKAKFAILSNEARIIRISTDNLASEYCHVVENVKTSKKNLQKYVIEVRKEFENELESFRKQLPRVTTLEDDFENYKEEQIKVHRQTASRFAVELQTVSHELMDKVDLIDLSMNKTLYEFDNTNNQVHNMNELIHKLDKQVHLTDFYLDKILPIQNFTQLMNVTRSVITTQDQFEKVEEMRKSFFSNFEEDVSTISTISDSQQMPEGGFITFADLANAKADVCGTNKHKHSNAGSVSANVSRQSAQTKQSKQKKKTKNLSRGSSYYSSSFEKDSAAAASASGSNVPDPREGLEKVCKHSQSSQCESVCWQPPKKEAPVVITVVQNTENFLIKGVTDIQHQIDEVYRKAEKAQENEEQKNENENVTPTIKDETISTRSRKNTISHLNENENE